MLFRSKKKTIINQIKGLSPNKLKSYIIRIHTKKNAQQRLNDPNISNDNRRKIYHMFPNLKKNKN